MPISRKTRVAIIGAGPSGLLLARLLHANDIDVVVLERRSREYVEGRIRAGVLEQGTVSLLEKAGAAERMRRDGHLHSGFNIAFADRLERIDLARYANSGVMVYGQTEVTKDLFALNDADGIAIHCETEVVAIDNPESSSPVLRFRRGKQTGELRSEFVAGCDGYHGVSRRAVPETALRIYEKEYPFGWLGVLSETRPAMPELIYANHERGFVLCSQRSPAISRNYIQVPAEEHAGDWSDDAFWSELRRRLPEAVGEDLDTGPAIEKSVAKLRSFIAEPMRHGSLFLVGDAAHIVPPTGAKGLNLAASDAGMLASALVAWYGERNAAGLERYSETALERVWKAERFSWWFTMATHLLSDNPFDQRMQVAELDYYTGTDAGRTSVAENYVGLPITDPVTGETLL